MDNRNNFYKRRTRVRSHLRKVGSSYPRLTVFRSSAHIWAQIIDPATNKTLVAAYDRDGKGTKTEKAKFVGTTIATLAIAEKIKKVVFDRGPYRYHGRVKALADAAREAGLEL